MNDQDILEIAEATFYGGEQPPTMDDRVLRFAKALLEEQKLRRKATVWYAKGAGGFFLKEETIPESARKLGLVALGEIDV